MYTTTRHRPIDGATRSAGRRSPSGTPAVRSDGKRLSKTASSNGPGSSGPPGHRGHGRSGVAGGRRRSGARSGTATRAPTCRSAGRTGGAGGDGSSAVSTGWVATARTSPRRRRRKAEPPAVGVTRRAVGVHAGACSSRARSLAPRVRWQQRDGLGSDHRQAHAVGGELPAGQLDAFLHGDRAPRQPAPRMRRLAARRGSRGTSSRIELGEPERRRGAAPAMWSAARRRSAPAGGRWRPRRARGRAGRVGRHAPRRRGGAGHGGACGARPAGRSARSSSSASSRFHSIPKWPNSAVAAAERERLGAAGRVRRRRTDVGADHLRRDERRREALDRLALEGVVAVARPHPLGALEDRRGRCAPPPDAQLSNSTSGWCGAQLVEQPVEGQRLARGCPPGRRRRGLHMVAVHVPLDERDVVVAEQRVERERISSKASGGARSSTSWLRPSTGVVAGRRRAPTRGARGRGRCRG